MALCPFAVHKLIPPGSSDPRITPRAAVWHVAVSMAASLFLFFRDRSGGIESHFYITWRGVIEQYRDTDFQADANLAANDFAVAIETAGFALGRWNPLQRKAMQRLAVWLDQTHAIPLQRCASPFGSGHGYHTMWGAPSPWTPVAKSCPGPNRIKQFDGWFVPWLRRAAAAHELRVRTRLRIRQANLWRENKHIDGDLQLLVKGRPHLVGTNESANWIEQLRDLAKEHGYRLITGTVAMGRSSTQNTILARGDLQVLGGGVRVMCEAVGRSPERTAAVVRYRFAGELRAHIATHANSHVQDGEQARRLPRVTQYVRHMKALRKLVHELERDGHRVTMTGDLNWAWTAKPAKFTHAPKRVLRRLGMRAQWGHKTAPVWRRRRIDYIAYDPDEATILEQHLVKGEHSDHPWPSVTLELKEPRP